MRLRIACAAAAFLLCATAWTADSPAQKLFDAAREKVLANVAKVPRYTCVETITRTQHNPPARVSPATCAAVREARARNTSPGILIWHDRLRLDVAVADGSEMFAWAGASKFETTDISQLALSGSTGSGAFGTFLVSVFGNDPDRYSYAGERDTELGRLAVFHYNVPLKRSHYTYKTSNGVNRTIGYTGSFYLTPGTAELRQLVVEANDLTGGEVCQVVDTMDYSSVRIGSREFLLPEVSRMLAVYENGDETNNETRFSGCHEYVGESTIRFDGEDEAPKAIAAAKEALQALPAKTRVRVHLASPIETEVAAAGDPVVGIVEREAREKGRVLVRTTDKLRGRLLRLEQFMLPVPRWIVAIRFDGIERDGVLQPVTFLPVDDGDRSPPAGFGRFRHPPLPTEPKGAGIFSFTTPGNLVLDEKFHSEWQVAR